MKGFKKIISFILCVAMIFGVAPLYGFVGFELPKLDALILKANAEEMSISGTCGENVTWEFDEKTDTLRITGFGDMEDIKSYSSPYYWESRWKDYNVKTVIIGEGITRIGARSFYKCNTITDVTLPSSLLSIGNSAFSYCSISSLVVPDNVTTIESNTFDFCENLKTVMIGSGLKEFDPYMFINSCKKLKYVSISENNPYLSADDSGVVFNKDKTKLIFYPRGITNGIYIVPDSVEQIGDYAFCKTHLVEVYLGDNLTSIGYEAFRNCDNLKVIKANKNLESIKSRAFDSCKELSDIYYSGSKSEWSNISISSNNECFRNANVHYDSISEETDYIIVTVNAYTAINGSPAKAKEFALTIASEDETAPLPDNTYSVIDVYGYMPFPIVFNEDDLQGLTSKTFKYELTISSVDDNKYDFTTETQPVEITVNNSNGKLSYVISNDTYDFNGFSYKDFVFQMTWDDGDDCCNVRPDSLNLNLASDINDYKVSFIVSSDSSWSATVSVREVDDEFRYHEYSFEGLDYLEQIGYNIYLREHNDGKTIYATASLPYCTVSFNTGVGSTIAKQYVVEDSLVKEPNTPTATYYNFIGWYKDENCTAGKEWNFETDVITQNLTLYAKWEPKPISITLKTEYGVLQDGENNKELTITIPACSAVGIKLSEEIYDSNYNHIGWVDEDGNVVTATTKLYEDTILYAVWQKKTYYDSTVSMKNNTGSKTINYGETLKLSVNTTNMPDGSKICWYVDGVKKGEGEVFEVSFEGGTKIVTVKIIGSDGNVLKDVNGNEISDSETVTVKAGFFQKLISFFKNLFGANRTVVQSIFKGVF